jgi:hypothetical protein
MDRSMTAVRKVWRSVPRAAFTMSGARCPLGLARHAKTSDERMPPMETSSNVGERWSRIRPSMLSNERLALAGWYPLVVGSKDGIGPDDGEF